MSEYLLFKYIVLSITLVKFFLEIQLAMIIHALPHYHIFSLLYHLPALSNFDTFLYFAFFLAGIEFELRVLCVLI
jgi:hypothetical protein